MVEVTNLTKRYGPHTAVDDISFSVPKGQIVGFLGPNGAGKSTTMNILTGYLSATDGEVTIDGTNILEAPEKVKSRIGYLPENPPTYNEMLVRDYLMFVGRIKRVAKSELKDRVEGGLDTVGIREVFHRRIGNLSKGYRQRVGLAQALLGDPDILVLDEPTAGLDPKQIVEIRELIRELGKDRTVILSSHILPEVSEICRRIMIISEGRIVADGEPETIGDNLFDTRQLMLSVKADETAAMSILEGVGASRIKVLPSTEAETTEFIVESPKNVDLREKVFRAFSESKTPILGMRLANTTLEEIFLALTSGVKGVIR